MAKTFKSFVRKNLTLRNILAIVGFILAVVIVISIVSALTDNGKKTVPALGTWVVGDLDSDGMPLSKSAKEAANGKYYESMYTKNYLPVDGLTIKLSDNATIVYDVYFYNNSHRCLGRLSLADVLGGYQSEDFTADADFFETYSGLSTAKFVRVWVRPVNTDGKMNVFEKLKYARMITVSYDKAAA